MSIGCAPARPVGRMAGRPVCRSESERRLFDRTGGSAAAGRSHEFAEFASCERAVGRLTRSGRHRPRSARRPQPGRPTRAREWARRPRLHSRRIGRGAAPSAAPSGPLRVPPGPAAGPRCRATNCSENATRAPNGNAPMTGALQYRPRCGAAIRRSRSPSGRARRSRVGTSPRPSAAAPRTGPGSSPAPRSCRCTRPPTRAT